MWCRLALRRPVSSGVPAALPLARPVTAARRPLLKFSQAPLGQLPSSLAWSSSANFSSAAAASAVAAEPEPVVLRAQPRPEQPPGTLVQYLESLEVPLAEYRADPLVEFLATLRHEPWMQDPDRKARREWRVQEAEAKAFREYSESWMLRKSNNPVMELIRKPVRVLFEFMERYGSRNLPLFLSTRSAVEHCLEQSERNEFYHFCGLVPEFQSELALATLHVWMVNYRLLQILPPQEAVKWRTAMLENFWMFGKAQMSMEGVHDLVLNRRLKIMQQFVMGAIQAYDHTFPMIALGNSAPFQAALWRNLYKADPIISKAHTVQVMRYMLREMDNLCQTEPEHILNSWINWGPPPSRLPHDIDEDLVDIRAYSATMFTQAKQ